MAQLGKFQMTAPRSMSGLATKASMASLFRKEPQRAGKMMVQLLATHRGKSLESELMGLGVEEFETTDEYTWQLKGSDQRNIPLIEARVGGVKVDDGDNNVGADGTEFELVFGEEWFTEGLVIVGEKPDLYPIIIEGVRSEGIENTVYTCKAIGGVQGGIPAEELLPNKRFSGEYTPVSDELSRGRMGGNVTTPMDMRGEFSTIRYGTKVTGTAAEHKVKTGIPVMDKSGNIKTFSAWMPYIQYKIEEEFSDMRNRVLMYARSNRTSEGLYLNKDFKTNLALKMGSGFREQMEVSNVVFYNKFSIELVESMLSDLSYSKLAMSNRRFILKTGEKGAIQFHKAVQATASGWTALISDGNASVISTTTSELHQNALKAGYQFVEFHSPNGVILRVEVDPIYDDPIRNKLKYKDGLAESYRYDIYYIGDKDEANMKIAKVKGRYDRRGFQDGPFGNPFLGTTTSNSASWDEDSAVMHVESTLGSILYDASRTASLIPTVLQ